MAPALHSASMMHAMPRRLPILNVSILALLLGGCVDPHAMAPGTRAAAITDGMLYDGHPSVGRLSLAGNDGLDYTCTGTLIGQRTVLTAAHCIDDIASATFYLGSQSYAVAQMIGHPSYTASPTRNDVAALRLTQTPSGVAPTAVATRAPWVGLGLTLIGFGITRDGADDSGSKRKASNAIADVQPVRFNMRGTGGGVGNICSGDSGGPAFAVIDGVEVQAGVHSYGEGDCGVSEWDARVDPFVPWLQQVAGGDVTLPPTPDTTAPQVAFPNLGDGRQVSAGSLVVDVAARDDRAVASVTLLLDGAALATRTQAPYRFDVTLAAGPHTLEARGVDSVGQTGFARVTVQAVGAASTPTPGPTVQIVSPGNGTLVPTQATIRTNVGGTIGNVVLVVDGAVVELRRQGPFDFVTVLTPGAHELTVVAEDPYGQRVHATVRVTADPQAPAPQAELRVLAGSCQLVRGDLPAQLGTLLPALLLGLLAARRRCRSHH